METFESRRRSKFSCQESDQVCLFSRDKTGTVGLFQQSARKQAVKADGSRSFLLLPEGLGCFMTSDPPSDGCASASDSAEPVQNQPETPPPPKPDLNYSEFRGLVRRVQHSVRRGHVCGGEDDIVMERRRERFSCCRNGRTSRTPPQGGATWEDHQEWRLIPLLWRLQGLLLNSD